jgi:hypothetical protein
MREVDDFNPPSHATAFSCRQAWTGAVQNYLTGIHLGGSLTISPAILADGKLRIAKATLATTQPARVALTACLFPDTPLAGPNPLWNGSNSPIDSSTTRDPRAGVKCNDTPDSILVTPIIGGGLGVNPLGAPGTPYITTADGSRVSVAGDITISNLQAEVLIGGNQ